MDAITIAPMTKGIVGEAVNCTASAASVEGAREAAGAGARPPGTEAGAHDPALHAVSLPCASPFRDRRHKIATTHRNLLFSPSPDDHDLYRLRHTENRRLRDYHRLDVEEDDDEDGEGEGPGNRPICAIQSPLKDWDGRQQSVDAISADSQSKHEVGSEKALAYAHTCTDQQWPPEQTKPQWRWNWLEQWMAVEQWEARHGTPRPPPLSSDVRATADMDGDLSEKTVEMDLGRVSPFHPATHYSYHSKDGPVRSRAAVPSYMAATQSAKANARTQSPPQAMTKTWTRRSHSGNVADSSSSSGGTPMYLADRSPGHIDGVGLNAQRRKHTGYNHDSSCD
ncbi:hypothetical protein ZIOFF_055886 [Zingiber officinale]|uniref:DUF4005 domain-containing protein n=1 Tax=Zingiber officinale TaxID=94328 RepID=A0A8J5FI86_ZINOF|nr:hypothetical protein ZIOFF_055886 [Zingiber officinale]